MKNESKTGARIWLRPSGNWGTDQPDAKLKKSKVIKRGLQATIGLVILSKYLSKDIKQNGGSNHELFRGLTNKERKSVFSALLYLQKVEAQEAGLPEPKKYKPNAD